MIDGSEKLKTAVGFFNFRIRVFLKSAVYKGINSRLGWTKYSDLYEIAFRASTSFFILAHWGGMREMSTCILDEISFDPGL